MLLLAVSGFLPALLRLHDFLVFYKQTLNSRELGFRVKGLGFRFGHSYG